MCISDKQTVHKHTNLTLDEQITNDGHKQRQVYKPANGNQLTPSIFKISISMCNVIIFFH
jgi:hypothetical protein